MRDLELLSNISSIILQVKNGRLRIFCEAEEDNFTRQFIIEQILMKSYLNKDHMHENICHAEKILHWISQIYTYTIILAIETTNL